MNGARGGREVETSLKRPEGVGKQSESVPWSCIPPKLLLRNTGLRSRCFHEGITCVDFASEGKPYAFSLSSLCLCSVFTSLLKLLPKTGICFGE